MQSLVLDGLSSPHTRRAYEQALDEFLIWLCADTARPFTKAAVQRYRTELQAKGLASASVNVRISAIRRLALEAGDNGLLAPEIAAGIGRVKGAKRAGVRLEMKNSGIFIAGVSDLSLQTAPTEIVFRKGE